MFFSLYIDDLVQDFSISSALAMEILQSCTKPSIWGSIYASQGRNWANIISNIGHLGIYNNWVILGLSNGLLLIRHQYLN